MSAPFLLSFGPHPVSGHRTLAGSWVSPGASHLCGFALALTSSWNDLLAGYLADYSSFVGCVTSPRCATFTVSLQTSRPRSAIPLHCPPAQQSSLGTVPRIQTLESDTGFSHPDPFILQHSLILPQVGTVRVPISEWGEITWYILMETFRKSHYVFPTHILLDCSGLFSVCCFLKPIIPLHLWFPST